MVQINFAQKQVNAKIVYYGPGMSGKTTNLEVIHQRAPEPNRGELTSISTDGDRTLFFDFMPLDLGTVAGMRTCFQIYTVPGQVYYNSTRKLVLQGVDGIVFVSDSSASMVEENLESMRNLEENLNEYGKSLTTLPHVIQFNKRDMPDALPVEELNQILNAHGAPTFEAIASTGQGVFPTLKALASRVLETIHSGSSGIPARGNPAAAPQQPAAAPRQGQPSMQRPTQPAAPLPVASAPPHQPVYQPAPQMQTAAAKGVHPMSRTGFQPQPQQPARGPTLPLHNAPPPAAAPGQGWGAPQQQHYAPQPGQAPGYAPQQAYAPAQPGYAPQGYAPQPGYAPPQPAYAPQPGYAPGPGRMPPGYEQPPQQPGQPGGLQLAARTPGGDQVPRGPERSRQAQPAARRAQQQPQPARSGRSTPNTLEGTRFRPRASRSESRAAPAKPGKGKTKLVVGVVAVVALVVGAVLAQVVFSLLS